MDNGFKFMLDDPKKRSELKSALKRVPIGKRREVLSRLNKSYGSNENSFDSARTQNILGKGQEPRELGSKKEKGTDRSFLFRGVSTDTKENKKTARKLKLTADQKIKQDKSLGLNQGGRAIKQGIDDFKDRPSFQRIRKKAQGISNKFNGLGNLFRQSA